MWNVKFQGCMEAHLSLDFFGNGEVWGIAFQTETKHQFMAEEWAYLEGIETVVHSLQRKRRDGTRCRYSESLTTSHEKDSCAHGPKNGKR